MKGTIKYGKELKWKDIKIGEAFYFIGCEGFGIKLDNDVFNSIDFSPEFFGMALGPWIDCGGRIIRNIPNVSCYTYYSIPKSLRECLEVL